MAEPVESCDDTHSGYVYLSSNAKNILTCLSGCSSKGLFGHDIYVCLHGLGLLERISNTSECFFFILSFVLNSPLYGIM
jgi:hypothetical protein